VGFWQIEVHATAVLAPQGGCVGITGLGPAHMRNFCAPRPLCSPHVPTSLHIALPFPALPCRVHPSGIGHQLLAELACTPVIQAVWELGAGLPVAVASSSQRSYALAPLPQPMIPTAAAGTFGFCAIQVRRWSILSAA